MPGIGEPMASGRRILAAQRQAEAVRLRAEGLDYAGIAARLGYASKSGAQKAVATAVGRIGTEEVRGWRKLELVRLDLLHKAVWQQAIAGDLRSIDTVIRISDQRCRLLGLYAPVRIDVAALAADSAKRFGLDAAERRALFDRLTAYLAAQRAGLPWGGDLDHNDRKGAS